MYLYGAFLDKQCKEISAFITLCASGQLNTPDRREPVAEMPGPAAFLIWASKIKIPNEWIIPALCDYCPRGVCSLLRV